jgi:broad specificity phosphatase PhoE
MLTRGVSCLFWIQSASSFTVFTSRRVLASMTFSSATGDDDAAINNKTTIVETTTSKDKDDEGWWSDIVGSGLSGGVLPDLHPDDKRLFLVRHGEVINPGGDRPVYYGAMDVDLSPLGKQEAQAAADYLSQFNLTHVFSSPLRRAMYGAKKVLEKQSSLKPTDVIVLEGFKELDRGDWCGKTEAEIGADMLAKFNACDESVTPPKGESYPALKARVMQALNTALSQMENGESACIVSHLQVTRSMLSEAMGMPTDEMSGLKVATASITCIDYDGYTPGVCSVQFQSFKPEAGLEKANDGVYN